MDLDGEAEIRDEAVLLHFTSTLQKVQEVAVAAERKAWEMKMRPKCYNGRSARTLYRQAAKRRKIAVDGNNSSGRSFDPKRTITHLLRLIWKVTTMTTVLILTAHAR